MSLVRFSTPMPSVFDKFFGNNEVLGWNNINNSTVPSVNIKESKNAFTVEVAAPGFEKNDFNLEINEDVLTISSKKETKNESEETEKYTRREYSYEAFTRSFSLPESVDSENIQAQYTNGILLVNIPKKEEAKPKPKRVIEIN